MCRPLRDTAGWRPGVATKAGLINGVLLATLALQKLAVILPIAFVVAFRKAFD